MNLNLAIVFGFVGCCYNSALVLTCFRLTKGRATFFPPKTIIVSFLHLVVLFFKVILNHSSYCQFLVLHCLIINTSLRLWLSHAYIFFFFLPLMKKRIFLLWTETFFISFTQFTEVNFEVHIHPFIIFLHEFLMLFKAINIYVYFSCLYTTHFY